MARLADAIIPLNTRPARSKRAPWQGQIKPPGQSLPRPLRSPDSSAAEGEQPRCVQSPMQTKISSRIDRPAPLTYAGWSARSEAGSARSASFLRRESSISADRLRIQTGFSRQATLVILPTGKAEMSTSSSPPNLAGPAGKRLATKGTLAATPSPPPTAIVAPSKRRRRESVQTQAGSTTSGSFCLSSIASPE